MDKELDVSEHSSSTDGYAVVASWLVWVCGDIRYSRV